MWVPGASPDLDF